MHTWCGSGVILQRVSEEPQHPAGQISWSEDIVRVNVSCKGLTNLHHHTEDAESVERSNRWLTCS